MQITKRVTGLPTHRPLANTARDIISDWSNIGRGVSLHAMPYLKAMLQLDQITDCYGLDSGSYIVNYALANMAQYRGTKARELKAELKDALKVLERPEAQAIANDVQKEAYL
jgi:hypothetical protein